jgi:hypothetical protein
LADLKELYICIKFASNFEKSWKLLASVCALVCTPQEVIDEMKTTVVALEDHKKRAFWFIARTQKPSGSHLQW